MVDPLDVGGPPGVKMGGEMHEWVLLQDRRVHEDGREEAQAQALSD